eukprot:748439-Hanusia_phi.AAC.5
MLLAAGILQVGFSLRSCPLVSVVVQAQLLSYEVPMCLVFGTRVSLPPSLPEQLTKPRQNPRHAQVCMEDFSLDLANVELYIDNSRKFQVYDALGMEQRKALKSNMNEVRIWWLVNQVDGCDRNWMRWDTISCELASATQARGVRKAFHLDTHVAGRCLPGRGRMQDQLSVCSRSFAEEGSDGLSRWRDETGIDPIPTQDLLDACAKLRKRTKAAGGKVAAGKPEEELVGMVYVPV